MTFFPYINKRPSEFAERSLSQTLESFVDDEPRMFENGPGITYSNLLDGAKGINKTPFVWNYLGTDIDMLFISGFSGAKMTADGYIEPQYGWAVAEKGADQEKDQQDFDFLF